MLLKSAKTSQRIILWLLVIIWMGIIFYLSAQTADQSSGLSGQAIRTLAMGFIPGFNELTYLQQREAVAGLQSIVRDAAHILTYFILGILTIAALFTRPWRLGIKIAAAFAICTLYAITDELHQLFVDGRAFELIDIFLDFCGAAAGALIMARIMKRFAK